MLSPFIQVSAPLSQFLDELTCLPQGHTTQYMVGLVLGSKFNLKLVFLTKGKVSIQLNENRSELESGFSFVGSETILPGLNLAALPSGQERKEEGLEYKSARGRQMLRCCRGRRAGRPSSGGDTSNLSPENRDKGGLEHGIPSDVGGVGVTAPYQDRTSQVLLGCWKGPDASVLRRPWIV